MKILVLDDQELIFTPPDDSVSHDFSQDQITHVYTEPEFKSELIASKWDEVWLDHDLGVENDSWSGTKATRWINSKGSFFDVGLFRITTMNPARQRAMKSDLEDNYDVVITPMSTIINVERGKFLWLMEKEQEV